VGTSPAPQSALATSKDRPSNSFYGLAIGSTVMAGALAVGANSRGRSANSGRVFTCASTVQMLRKVVDSELDSAVIEEAKRTLKATRNANNSGSRRF
jgi:hypothetical protein